MSAIALILALMIGGAVPDQGPPNKKNRAAALEAKLDTIPHDTPENRRMDGLMAQGHRFKEKPVDTSSPLKKLKDRVKFGLNPAKHGHRHIVKRGEDPTEGRKAVFNAMAKP